MWNVVIFSAHLDHLDSSLIHTVEPSENRTFLEIHSHRSEKPLILGPFRLHKTHINKPLWMTKLKRHKAIVRERFTRAKINKRING